jgi:Prp31 C terminal domain
VGASLKRALEDKLEKMQEPLKAKTKKALPIPEEKKRSKRGGRRVRRLKERYAVSELQAQHNKISFSLNEGEYGDSAMGVDKGMIGSKDTGRIRAPSKKENKVGLSKKQKVSMVRSPVCFLSALLCSGSALLCIDNANCLVRFFLFFCFLFFSYHFLSSHLTSFPCRRCNRHFQFYSHLDCRSCYRCFVTIATTA